MKRSEDFYTFLKRNRRKDTVAEQVIELTETFADFIQGRTGGSIDTISPTDLDNFVSYVEGNQSTLPGVKNFLWAIRHYYRFIGNDEMAAYVSQLRATRIKPKPFLLKAFLGISPEHVGCLGTHGIKHTQHMLKVAKTAEQRASLAAKTGIPPKNILEYTKLADLARIPGVKGIRARLYHDAGIDTVEKMAGMSEEDILQITSDFVSQTGFEGIPPLPAEVRHSIETAKNLPKIVQF